MSDDKKKNYRDTLNLPKTSFAMKANLVQREPQMRKRWAKENIYGKIRTARQGAKPYILHDGPPYANGDIHMGHVINKVLKDIVIKYKTMTGFDAPYVPGWDCHGLPIEAKVMTDLGEKVRQMTKPQVRKDCMKYAGKYVKLQGRQFQALGIFGDFENPYLTFKPQYEAGILEVFAELVGKGLVYRQLKPIHWSIGCETALAEAELEYKDIASPSIFVNFPAVHETITRLIELGLVTGEQAKDASVCFMIWTTTPWTLAANLAIAVHPHLEYTTVAYEKDGRKLRLSGLGRSARSRGRGRRAGTTGNTRYRRDRRSSGSELEGLRYSHPFIETNPTDKDAYMVVTGRLRHDRRRYGLGPHRPRARPGRLHDGPEARPGRLLTRHRTTAVTTRPSPTGSQGKNVLEVDKEVNELVWPKPAGFSPSVRSCTAIPHCWRSKGPVIFRATEQWFVGVDRRNCPKRARTCAKWPWKASIASAGSPAGARNASPACSNRDPTGASAGSAVGACPSRSSSCPTDGRC